MVKIPLSNKSSIQVLRFQYINIGDLASHPFDLSYDDLVRIKMLFPENKALFGEDKKHGNFVTNGVDL